MTSFWSWGSSMRTDRALLLVPLLAAVVGCDRNGRDLVQRPDADNPAVLQIGELAVVDVQPDWLDGNGDIGALYVDPSFCAGQDGEQRCYFGSVGTPEPGVRGGATFTFKGTGDVVTILMDAETVLRILRRRDGRSVLEHLDQPDRAERVLCLPGQHPGRR